MLFKINGTIVYDIIIEDGDDNDSLDDNDED